MLHASATGDVVIASGVLLPICQFVQISHFLPSEEKSLMADTWVENGFVPFKEIIQSWVHGLKRTPAFPCILLELWLNSSTKLILVLLCGEEIVRCACHLPEVSSYF